MTPEELTAINDHITSINHFAQIIHTERSRIKDIGAIIGINSFNVDRCVELDPALFEDSDAPEVPGSPKKMKKVHDLSMVSSCGIQITGNFDVVKFNTFMGTLLAERAKDIYRSKLRPKN